LRCRICLTVDSLPTGKKYDLFFKEQMPLRNPRSSEYCSYFEIGRSGFV
jgi:hypothetical protein